MKITISSHWKMTKGRQKLEKGLLMETPLTLGKFGDTVAGIPASALPPPAQLHMLEMVVWVQDGKLRNALMQQPESEALYFIATQI